MRLYKMELFKLFQNKIFKIGMLAATGLLFLYFWFAEVGGVNYKIKSDINILR